ncbi:MAG: hypothetical protein DLM73_09325 [Chthoniobacterales bacterium]|nr:MAG: hypothetical protein DLM73_09325 [Chthoniobacterales bacterium]
MCRGRRREISDHGRFSQVNGEGTAVAKKIGMLTISAFVIALGSVFMSVVWACKEDLTNRA